jgi:hypothetical protein
MKLLKPICLVPPAQYGEYNTADPLSRQAPYAGEYGAGYDRGAYSSYQAPAPRPLFDASQAQYRRQGGRPPGAYFSEARNQRNFVPPRMQQQRPEKRRREQSRPRQQNRTPNQRQFTKKEDEKPKNGGNKDENGGSDDKQSHNIDSRFLFEKTDDAVGLFEKCNNLGKLDTLRQC